VTSDPATTTVGAALLDIARSAEAAGTLTFTVAVAELFDGFVSVPRAETFAVLLIVPLAAGSTRATIVKVVAVLAAKPAIVHVTVPPVPTGGDAQVHVTGAVTERKVVLAGSVSERITLLAVPEPAGFVTVTVYVRFWPAVTGLGAAVLVTPRLMFVGVTYTVSGHSGPSVSVRV
jgi:hypothetical protein